MGLEMDSKQSETKICCLMELREERDLGGSTVEGMGLTRSSREDGLGQGHGVGMQKEGWIHSVCRTLALMMEERWMVRKSRSWA